MRKLAQLLQQGEVSSTEIVQNYLDRIAQEEGRINAFITVDKEGALAEAAASDARRKQGEPLSPWDGIPIAVKDNICTLGVRTTCGSRMLENYVPPFDAAVVTLLKRAGLPILGKTNLDEFAMGSSTEYSAFKAVRNPHDESRVPGGSSGGSAAAVAVGEAPWALGTDTGGSIRQPAAFCGVVGLKPTYGRVSRYGLVALAPSLDQIGPIARNVGDAAVLFSLIAGPDSRDATSSSQASFRLQLEDEPFPKGLKIGVPEEYFGEGLSSEVRQAVENALSQLEALGAVLVPISLETNVYAIDTYLTIAAAEASSSLARYDGVRYGMRVEAHDTNTMFEKTRGRGFGSEVKRRIMLGTYVLSASHYEAYYEQAQRVRTLINQEVQRAFEEVDLVITPTTPTTAFRIGEKRNSLEMYLSDLYTAMANLTGIPALSMPCGLDSQGLPIGLQIMGSHFQEKVVFQVAYWLENALKGGSLSNG